MPNEQAAPAAPKHTPAAPRKAEAEAEVETPLNPEEQVAKTGEPVFFETTVAKLVKDADGEWVDVMSDNLYPGERLKRLVDEEIADEKADDVKASALADREDRRKAADEHRKDAPKKDAK